MKTFIWWADYRPTKLKNYVCDAELRRNVENWISTKTLPHLLLTGVPGTGKTTLAKIILNEFGYKRGDYMWINASKEANIDTLRTSIEHFASTKAISDDVGLKIIVLDEVDGATYKFQEALRAVMEDYINVCRFIMTCNYISKVTPAIQSRCNIWKLNGVSKETIFAKCKYILETEKIEYNKEDLIHIINLKYPDFRQILHTLQQFSKHKKLELKELNNKTTIAKILAEIDNKNINNIRKIIVEESIDYIQTYKILFKYYLNKTNVTAAVIIGEYMYRHATHADAEINFLTCCLKIMDVING